MNGRQLERNRGRIPRLVMHIERCKAKAKAAAGTPMAEIQMARVASFQAELERRLLEMQAAGHGKEAEKLMKVNILAR